MPAPGAPDRTRAFPRPTPFLPALPGGFAFATGIECSYPVIQGHDGRAVRVDEMERTFHYRYWREDLQLVLDLGLRYLRYGPRYYAVHAGPRRYDWEFTDQVMGAMRRLGILPIVDLCHFGLPDWVGSFQNRDWPRLFAEYAAEPVSFRRSPRCLVPNRSTPWREDPRSTGLWFHSSTRRFASLPPRP